MENSSSSSEINKQLYQRLGSTWLLDSVYLFIMSPLGFVGFVLNIMFLIFILARVKQANHIRLYKYLTIDSINSSVICFLLTFVFINFSPRYFEFTFNNLTKFYRCFILTYFIASLSLFSYLLDIVILIDRMSLFLNYKITRLNQIKPFTKCFIILIICFLINLPLLFSIDGENLNETRPLCIQTLFAKSNQSFIINVTLIFVRDVLTLILQVIITIVSIYYYRNFSSRSIYSYYFISMKTSDHSLSLIKPTDSNGYRLLQMSIYLSIISIISHLVNSMAAASYLGDHFEVMFSIVGMSIIIKHICNAFIFYYFNCELKKMFIPLDLFQNGI